MVHSKLEFESEIEIKNFPLEWLPTVRLFDPYLPQYPIIYVHIVKNKERIFGFPTHFSVKNIKNKSCTLAFNFVCNIDLGKNGDFKKVVGEELENRFGTWGKIDLKTLKESCNGNNKYNAFVEDLWNKYVSTAYGNFLPFGRFYEEMFSIVKFAGALAPLSGGKSEMQMLYDFMRYYGTKVAICDVWAHLEFYLIPTYEEVFADNIDDYFGNYKKLYDAMKKFANLFFKDKLKINNKELQCFSEKMTDVRGCDIRKSYGFRKLTDKLVQSQEIGIGDKEQLDYLVDAFNRMPLRAISYIGSMINIGKKNDLRKWSKNEFVKLYSQPLTERKGVHPKIMGCYLQQGFGNEEVAPIDEWVKSFYTQVLQISDKVEFLNSFSKIGKFERLIWVTSQARKTNMRLFFDVLWCIKYGTGASTGGEKRLRGPNPLSCLRCTLKDKCLGFNSIKEEQMYVQENRVERVRTPSDCKFTVVTLNDVPKLVFSEESELIDAFSGHEIHRVKTKYTGKKVKIIDFLKNLKAV